MNILEQNITLYRGDSKEIIVSMVDGSGSPIDFAGAEDIIYILAKNPSADIPADVVKKKSEGTVAVAGEGGFKVNLRHDDTKDLIGKYMIECRLVNGEVNTTIIRGVMEFIESMIISKNLI